MKINYILKEDFDDLELDVDISDDELQREIEDEYVHKSIKDFIRNTYDIMSAEFVGDKNDYTMKDFRNWEPYIRILRNSDLKTPFNIKQPYIVTFDVVSVKIYVKETAKNISSLFNDLFTFIYIDSFSCERCSNIQNLEGFPLQINRCDIRDCKSLKTLKGCPNIIDSLACINCENLESIADISPAISELNRLALVNCKKLKSLVGMPAHVNNLDLCGCTGLQTTDGYTYASALFLTAPITKIRLAFYGKEVTEYLDDFVANNAKIQQDPDTYSYNSHSLDAKN